MSEAPAIARTTTPATRATLAADLRALGLQAGMTVLVHSSLSALGYVVSGAPSVILALEDVLGETGTLMMPTHSSDLSDPAHWRHPPVPAAWVDPVRDAMPAYQMDLTPTRQMGAIAETFRKQDGVRRSNHPQDSFAARGPQAEFITTNHRLQDGLGESSPLARLYDLDGWVLLLGVRHQNNTSLHLAETRAQCAGKKFITQGAPIFVNGERQWVAFEALDYNDEDFPAIGAALAETGAERVGRVALAEARLMPQRALVDFGVQWMERNRMKSEA